MESIDELIALMRKRRVEMMANNVALGGTGTLSTEDGHPYETSDGRTLAFEFAVIELLVDIRERLTPPVVPEGYALLNKADYDLVMAFDGKPRQDADGRYVDDA